jgi:hypothetical protein
MPKSNYIPPSDLDFLAWTDHFINNLTPNYGVLDTDLTLLKNAAADFHAKIAHANDAAALAKQATAEKNNSRHNTENLYRAEVKRIKARADYTEGLGANLGIEGPENTYDLNTSKPDLSGIDQTGGNVILSFTKYKSEGINLYCQRENDADWVLLGRATVSPFQDNRPLLQIGKPELRPYTAVFMLKDKEIGQYSDDIVINCAP